MSFTLRPYQERCLADLWSWFEAHGDGDPVIEACVGAGKSIMIAETCRRALEAYPDTRILMVVHIRELLQQNLQKLVSVWPDAPAGVYSASVGSRTLGRPITYATIGSVARRAHQLGQVDMLLIDEAHLVSPSEQTMYRRLIDDLRRYCPSMRVIGWTGTAYRGDGVFLTQQGLFTHVAARVTMRELLDAGFLAPLTVQPTATRISTDDVRTSGGDFVVSALAQATDRAEIVRAACGELVRLAADRRRWLVFAVTIEHAGHIAAELRDVHGIDAAVVSAETPAAERDALIAAFRTGRLRALVNVAVLTTGFDVPELDCIALLRATKSPVLYTQIAGRGLRTAPGKSDCIAEGQRVLTDRGLVPIERVTRDMRVWDGVSFVEHGGAICKGEQDVITYAGLTATPDHRVWTAQGWVRFGDCAAAGLAIAVGGDGRAPVREAAGHFRGRDGHHAHEEDCNCTEGSCVQAGASARSLCRHDAVEVHRCRPDATRDYGTVGAAVLQAKRRVWDLLNAGPLHRFTCEGLIVSNCLWLDFTDTTERLGPVDRIRGRAKPQPGDAPIRYCPECGSMNRATAAACTSCGHGFPPPAEPERIKHRAWTAQADVLSRPDPTTWHSVTEVLYRHHHGRDGKPDTLRVDYRSGLRVVASEWLCFDHPPGWARARAQAWWAQRWTAVARGEDPPASVAEALDVIERSDLAGRPNAAMPGDPDGCLREPARIRIKTQGRYPEIVEFAWPADETHREAA